jgi:hypothetical protein
MKKLIALFAFFVLMTAASFAVTTNTMTLNVSCPGPTLQAASNATTYPVTAPGSFSDTKTYTVAGWGADGIFTWTAVLSGTGDASWVDATTTTTGIVDFGNVKACDATKTFDQFVKVNVPSYAIKQTVTYIYTITVAD